jgi:hypothetical protein
MTKYKTNSPYNIWRVSSFHSQPNNFAVYTASARITWCIEMSQCVLPLSPGNGRTISGPNGACEKFAQLISVWPGPGAGEVATTEVAEKFLKTILTSLLTVGILTLVGGSVHAIDKQKETLLLAHLRGYQEVPSVSTPATGEFRAVISKDEQSITYELRYQGLKNTISQAHIHFGQRSVNGSIVIWLCGTASNPGPAGTQTCPQSATGNLPLTGTITAANVIAASTTSQLITAGELAEVIATIRAGVAYANIHGLPLNGGGEIRGQIKAVGPKESSSDAGND